MSGEELESVMVSKKGLVGDRSYALIDTQTNKIVSAKNPKKWPNIFMYSSKYLLEPTENKISNIQIKIPNRNEVILSSQEEIDEILSASLNRSVKLTSIVPKKVQLEEYSPDIDNHAVKGIIADAKMADNTFFDLGTIHIITTATISKLKEIYPKGDFNINRFRPNIVIDLDQNEIGFVENEWVGQKIAIGNEVVLKIKEHCPRCVMTTLEQHDISKDINILKTIKKSNNGNLGIYADVIQMGHIKKNDLIKIIN